jgi:hypothetical protein
MAELRLPYPAKRAESRGIDKAAWGVLINSTFPNAETEDAIFNAYDLAKVKGLDVFGGHIAIVQQNKMVDNNWVTFETCWLTLKAQIFAAHKSGAFAGMDAIQYGPRVTREYTGTVRKNNRNEQKTIKLEVPEFAEVTVYRRVEGERCAFSETLWFDDMVPLSKGLPKSMWAKSPTMMFSKCLRAACLRLAFPECDYSAEEMDGQIMQSNESNDVLPEGGAPTNIADQAASQQVEAPVSMGEPERATYQMLQADQLEWLDRTLQTTCAVGAFEEAKANLFEIADVNMHGLGRDLIDAAADVFSDPRGPKLWEYLLKARDAGPKAYPQVKTTVTQQFEANALSEKAKDGALSIVEFFEAVPPKAAERRVA